jgi:hypothetical protein
VSIAPLFSERRPFVPGPQPVHHRGEQRLEIVGLVEGLADGKAELLDGLGALGAADGGPPAARAAPNSPWFIPSGTRSA